MYKLSYCILFALVFSSSCKQKQPMEAELNYAFRLIPGSDLKESIDSFVRDKNIQAGWIATCVGSLTDYHIRFANQEIGDSGTGHFEIVSLVGTVSVNGSHLHVAVSDSTGKTIGGHLLPGCKVYTTAEIVIGEATEKVFTREKDGSTPWEELKVNEGKHN
jgi:predicted DNA-binding protein with PD1-like motif